MNQLTKVFEGNEIRIIGTEKEPYFMVKDVCAALSLSNPSMVANRVRDKYKANFSLGLSGSAPVFVSEAGLYQIIMRSDQNKVTERFQDWVYEEVLPSIRQDGGYIAATAEQTPEEIMARAVLVANKTLERIQKERDQLEREKLALLHCGKLYTSTEVAKELGFKSANALNKMLEQEGVQYFVNKTWVLKAKYADKGYTSIKQLVLENGRTVYDRKWTGLGRDFLIQKFGTGVA